MGFLTWENDSIVNQFDYVMFRFGSNDLKLEKFKIHYNIKKVRKTRGKYLKPITKLFNKIQHNLF